MDDGSDWMFMKYFIKGGAVPQIYFVKKRFLFCNFGDSFQNGCLAVGKVIYNNV